MVDAFVSSVERFTVHFTSAGWTVGGDRFLIATLEAISEGCPGACSGELTLEVTVVPEVVSMGLGVYAERPGGWPVVVESDILDFSACDSLRVYVDAIGYFVWAYGAIHGLDSW